MSSKKGLFLDLDGTLADSLSVMEKVYYEFLQFFGMRGSTEEFRELNGPNLMAVVSILQKRYSLAESEEELIEKYIGMVQKSYSAVPVSPGAEDLLRCAVAHQWTCAVVTSSYEEIAHSWLQSTRLAPFVSLTVGAESVALGKPHPQLYLTALERSGCKPQSSLAIEDSENGLTAARSAGISTFLLARDASIDVGTQKISSLRDMIPVIEALSVKESAS